MSFLSKLLKATATTALLTVGATVAVNQSASASSLVPQQEGEVCLSNLASLTGNCITSSWFTVESVENSPSDSQANLSYLFVDKLTTANNYTGGVSFLAVDAGTNPDGYWFRPVEDELEESGQLEVGTFKFNFTQTISELKIAYFDTEWNNNTGVPTVSSILQTDGTQISGNNPIVPGPNGNIAYQTWKNVNFITLKLGKDYTNGTGDGVDFQMESVPEPSTTLGLGLLAAVGAFKLRKRQQKG